MLGDVNPLMVTALVLLAGLLAGHLAHLARLPRIIGQILVGALLGPSVIGVFSHDALTGIDMLTPFALGFIALTVGEHLNVRALRNAGKRLVALLACESLIVPALVIGVTYPILKTPWLPLLLGAMAVSTAPATVIALVKESRAKGVFVRTLTAAVALNNIACIALFAIAQAVAAGAMAETGGAATGSRLGPALLSFAAAVLLGSAGGGLLVLLTRREMRVGRQAAATIAALLLVTGICIHFGLSVLLACLFLGITLANLLPRGRDIGASSMEGMEPALLALFFTLAGMELDFSRLAEAGLLALAVSAARFAGKMLAANLGMRLAGATRNVRRYLGLALIPQAGVAVGLILAVQHDPALGSIAPLLLTAGLASVLLNEVAGSITAHVALRKSGDAGKDRPRLMDFIEEQHIITNLEAETKEEAIRRLADLMIHTHSLKVDPAAFADSVLARERRSSTCIGAGLAVPHGELSESDGMAGVMAVSSRGFHFETPDGQPVHCIVLLGTPPSQRDRHVQVMAGLARMVDSDAYLRSQLFSAQTPAHAHDVIHAEASEDFNHYLED